MLAMLHVITSPEAGGDLTETDHAKGEATL
jgi:hypothetical protein